MGKYRLRAYLFLTIGAIISGFAGPVIKLTLTKLTPDVFLFYRFFISSILVILLLPFFKFKLPKNPKILFDFFVFGFLNITVALGLLFWGAAKTTLLNMSLISIFGPILTVVIAHFILREHLTKRTKLGILVAFSGSFLIIIGPFLATGDHLGEISGNLLIFGALLAGTLASIMVKKLLRQGADAISLSNFSFVIGFVSFLIYEIISSNIGNAINTIINLPFAYHMGVFYMAILSGTVAYYLGIAAQKSIEVSEAAIFSYIYPLISAALAVILLGESVSIEIIIGSIITFVGVYLAEFSKRR